MATRSELGRAYLQANASGPLLIGRESGIARADLSQIPEFTAAAEECRQIAATRSSQALPTKGSLDFVATGKDFGPQSAAVALAQHAVVLAPVISYFGCLPVLFSIGFNRAQTSSMQADSSHYFHLDPEDVTQIKVFIALSDVEEDRAFHALPADLSEQVTEHLDYTAGRLTDQQVDEIVGLERLVSSAGPAGTAVFCDTNRCIHYGGRPGRLVRDLLVFTYALPTSTWFPLNDWDGVRRNLLPQLKPREGDAFWNALIGADLI